MCENRVIAMIIMYIVFIMLMYVPYFIDNKHGIDRPIHVPFVCGNAIAIIISSLVFIINFLYGIL